MNKLGITPHHTEKISDYHLDMRALQLSEMRDPVWGYTSPHYVITHDQVPLELVAKNEKTIENKGDDEVYDASTKDADVKRFCTLNLFGVMEYREDMLNVPPIHLVFKASKFRTGDEWHDEDERKQWDSRVVVSFQPNAWVDEETHKYGLKKVLGPINELLEREGTGMRGVTIEDNLSVHHTSGTQQFWKEELKHFDMPRFVPANMTEIVQAIDRHVGVRYKEAVYTAYRKEMWKRLSAAREAAGTAEGVTIDPLTPKERRILVTRAAADEHERVIKSGAYHRAFIATATWMPIWHLVREGGAVPQGPACVKEESQVSLQHMPEYNYTELCSAEKVHARVDKINREEEEARATEERIEAEAKAKAEAERVAMAPFVEKARGLMSEIESVLHTLILEDLMKIHHKTGYEEFLIGGSWASKKIAEALTTICMDDVSVETIQLVANDVDVYHGEFTTDHDKSLSVNLNRIKYQNIDGINLEINTVGCTNLSPHSFLANNDLNITASCFHIDTTKDELFSIHALPCFWRFAFEKNESRRIEPVGGRNANSYGATTCIRLAYKAFQMKQFGFSLGAIDPAMGTIAESQKKKLDDMKNWNLSPFREYQCNKRGNHYVLTKKHPKITCAGAECIGWSNKLCSYKMCKKCCIEHVLKMQCAACRVKSHVPKSNPGIDASVGDEDNDATNDNTQEDVTVIDNDGVN